MDIQRCIGKAEVALDMFQTRLRFIDCYEQVLGFVAEAIQKAAEEATTEALSFAPFYQEGD